MLKGLNPSLSEWVEGAGLTKLTKIERRGMLLHISEVRHGDKEVVVPLAVQKLL